MNPFHEISIGGILPQREPFVFVDRLEHYDDVETVTSFIVKSFPESWAGCVSRTVCAPTLDDRAQRTVIQASKLFLISVPLQWV